MNDEKYGKLLGMILGDGHIERVGNSCRVRIVHGHKQLKYLQHKAKLLESILEKPVRVVEGSLSRGRYRQFYAQTTHDVFRRLHDDIYRFNEEDQRYRKRYTRKLLDKLTPEGIALWYMDDGCLANPTRNGQVYASQLTLATYVSRKQNEIISDYFREVWNVGFNIGASGKSFRLYCGTREARKLVEIVEPWVVPSLAYKLNVKQENSNRR